MTGMTDATLTHVPNYPPRHYPTSHAKVADLVVHVVGLTLSIIGGGIMLGLAISRGDAALITAISIYALGIIAMLSFSTAYNFAPAQLRPGRNKFDHAGIFLMIGASYTPFTVVSLTGAWSWAMTSTVWGIAGTGALGRMLGIKMPQWVWVTLYIALGWIILVALWPMMSAVGWVPLLLLFLGGVLYTVGVAFYVNKSLTYSTAIWHGHVVAAAGLQWAAILLGVVLA